VQAASVLQAQHDELASDVFDGMCALGIESHRAAALADALSAAGVDPNPILTAVESEHLEAHAARMMASEGEDGMSRLSDVHMDDAVSTTPLQPPEGESAVIDSLIESVLAAHDNAGNVAAVLSPLQTLTMQIPLLSRFLLFSADTICQRSLCDAVITHRQ
jgi:hypothetical protein